MNILVTGASGLIGGKFYEAFSKDYCVIGTYCNKPTKGYAHLQLEDKNSIDNLFNSVKPNIVIHSAAIADPEKCKVNKDLARKINYNGTEYITDACKKHGSLLFFLSTSHVFREGKINDNDKKSPINFYGQLKSESEDYITNTLENAVILRPPKVYGYTKGCEDFTQKIIVSSTKGKELELDNVIKYYPVIIDDLVDLTRMLIDYNMTGIYNISSSTAYTKFEWANLICKKFGIDNSKIIPGDGEAKLERSRDLHFDLTKVKNVGLTPTELEEGIERVKNR